MSLAERTILIAGCGYLGTETARVFKRKGWRVCALTLSPESARDVARLVGIETVHANLGDADSLRAVKGILPRFSSLVHCASSNRGGEDAYRNVFLEGSRNLLEIFDPRQFLFTSSTSVYHQTDGAEVTEESPTEPKRETTRILLESEKLVLDNGGTVARISGIYGPDRSAILKKFFQRTAVLENGGGRFLNQIHRDDAAAAIYHLVASGHSAGGGIYNVSDSHPMTQKDVYEWLCGVYELPVPPVASANPNRKRGLTSKRVSNEKLRSTGWQPQFPSFRDAVDLDMRLAPSIQSQLVVDPD